MRRETRGSERRSSSGEFAGDGLVDGAVESKFLSGALLPDAGGRRPALEALLERITPENMHGEVDTGRPLGREVW